MRLFRFAGCRTGSAGWYPKLAVDLDGDSDTDLVAIPTLDDRFQDQAISIYRNAGGAFAFYTDSDGDVDFLGATVTVRGRSFRPPASGFRRQYGIAVSNGLEVHIGP